LCRWFCLKEPFFLVEGCGQSEIIGLAGIRHEKGRPVFRPSFFMHAFPCLAYRFMVSIFASFFRFSISELIPCWILLDLR